MFKALRLNRSNGWGERRTARALLAADLPVSTLAGMAHDIALGDAIAASADLLDGRLIGRAVVDMKL